MASQPIGPIQQESLAELAYRALWSSIVEGRLTQGHRLVETSLARDLGISRGPIREALRRLSEEGLVDQIPRRGSFVRSIDAHDLVDIYNVRLAIETAAVRLLIRRNASLRSLERLIERMDAAAAKNDLAEVVSAEFAFHEQLFRLAGNPYLLRMFKSISAQIRIALTVDNQTFLNLFDVVEEHVALLDALRGGGGGGGEMEAVHAIQSHIISTIGGVLERAGVATDALLSPLPT